MADQQPGSRAGKMMMVFAWLIIMSLAFAFFSQWEKKRYNRNQSPESYQFADYNKVVLNSGTGGHYIATGTVNGQEVNFVLDTGATSVALSKELAEKLRLKKMMPVKLSTANGEANGWATRLDSVKLGSIELFDISAVIVPQMDDEVLLGMSFLRQLEFSQRDGQMTLRQYKRNY